MTNLVPYDQMQNMASAIASSGLFGIKTQDQALALMIVAQAEGRHPGIVARDYHIIQGRPTLKADAMLARFQESGGSVKWHDMSDTKVEATFSHPQGGELRIGWTIEDAKRAGLLGKENWQKYPRAMLRSRLISETIRSLFPGVICGVYTDEETEDFAPVKVEKDITHITKTLSPQWLVNELNAACDELLSMPGISKQLADWLKDKKNKADSYSEEDVSKMISILQARKAALLIKSTEEAPKDGSVNALSDGD